MARFIFTGDPANPGTDPDELTIFGVTFPHGKPISVDEAIADRLRRHSHFREEDRMAAARAAKAARRPM